MRYTVKDENGQDARFTEGTDGQAVAVLVEGPNGEPLLEGVVDQVLASLETDDGVAIFTSEDCTPGAEGSRGSINDDGELVFTFTVADMVAIGTRELQGRRLSYTVTHSGGLIHNGEETFMLEALRGAPVAAP